MKQDKHVKEAKFIGDDSFDLINFNQLPRDASIERQIAALREDQRWQENHNIEVSRRIDYLIQDIEAGQDDEDYPPGSFLKALSESNSRE